MAGLLVMAGCGGSRDVILGALSPQSITRVGAAPAPSTPARASPTPAPVPPPPPTTSAAPALTAAAPPPTTTAVAVPAVATHDATLSALASPREAVPVAVDAGGTALISGPVVGAGVDAASGELAVPADASVVAWYEYGPAPGQAGSAVLAGHVDWHGVPGIFFRLRELQAGDPVTVTMSDGTVLGFHVVDARLVDKPELPRAEVFARAGPPTLRLVTCGGEFDSSTHHYRSNMVVTAVPD